MTPTPFRPLALLLLLPLLLAAPRDAFAAAGGETGIAVTTERVVVFKDGYSLFVKNCRGRLDEAARATIAQVPEAMVLGSFFALPKEGRIRSITAKRAAVRRDGRDEIRKTLVVEFERESAGKEVEFSLHYYTPGIRWIPTYRIGLAGAAGEAAVAMQAEILNESEDLNGIPVELVVGVPNFRFKRSVSPMSLEPSLRDPLGAASPVARPRFGDDDPDLFSNAIMSQRVMTLAPAPPAPETAPAGSAPPVLPPELSGEGSQDFHVYKIPALHLAAGERAVIPLLEATCPVRHFHAWDARIVHPGHAAPPAADGAAGPSPVRLAKNEVWHLLELTNKTEHPFTTGSALVMDDGLPVCQELLGYTPPGGRTQLPVTIAVDLAASYAEEETGRVKDATVFDGDQYAKISKRGKLRVASARKSPVELMVTFHAGGNATLASDEGKITIGDFQNADWANFRGNPALTGHSTILWTLKLEPGESRELTCEYEYFLR